MTEISASEREQRIRRLQERRAATARRPTPDRTASGLASTAAASVERTSARPPAQPTNARRRHPAAATRWLLGGLSIASFFGIAGTVAVANQTNLAASPPPQPVVTQPPATSATAPSPAAASTPSAATPVSDSTTKATGTTASAAPRAHTTSRGS